MCEKIKKKQGIVRVQNDRTTTNSAQIHTQYLFCLIVFVLHARMSWAAQKVQDVFIFK